MSVLKFDPTSLKKILSEEATIETGMDFIEIVALVSCPARQFEDFLELVVRGNGYASPLMAVEELEDVFTLERMIMQAFNKELIYFEKPEEEMKDDSIRTWGISALTVSLPGGFVPKAGFHNLIGSVALKKSTRFFRYTSDPIDHRFTAGAIASSTYLTTENDQHFVNSGFGAVGRYAMPMPMPASFEHEYEFPAGTILEVGTVGPNFGQSGGGVEVRTTTRVHGVRRIKSVRISDA